MTRGPSIVLVGFRGSGKSTIGASLARRLRLPFVDTDEMIEREAGVSVAELFDREGEARFREIESAVVAAIDARVEQVVATGGGVVTDDASRRCLGRLGLVVWLDAPTKTLRRRIAASARPSLTGRHPENEVEALMRERAPLYREVADEVVESGERTVEEICDELQQLRRVVPRHDLR